MCVCDGKLSSINRRNWHGFSFSWWPRWSGVVGVLQYALFSVLTARGPRPELHWDSLDLTRLSVQCFVLAVGLAVAKALWWWSWAGSWLLQVGAVPPLRAAPWGKGAVVLSSRASPCPRDWCLETSCLSAPSGWRRQPCVLRPYLGQAVTRLWNAKQLP